MSAPTVNLPAGIHAVEASRYHADELCDQPTLSASIAKILCDRTPLHAWTAHPRLNPNYRSVESDAFDLGTAVHGLILEGGLDVVIVDATNWTTKDAKAQREDARAAGRTALLRKDWDRAQEMRDAVIRQLTAYPADPPLIVDGRPEQTIIWEEDGIMCRSLVDWLRDDHAAADDLKSTSASASPEKWSRTMMGFGGDVQAAFHARGLRAVTGRDILFRFVVAETYPPYAMAVHALAPSALELANDKVEKAIALWRQCMASGRWPGYPKRVAYVEAPSWEITRWLDRQEEDAA